MNQETPNNSGMSEAGNLADAIKKVAEKAITNLDIDPNKVDPVTV